VARTGTRRLVVNGTPHIRDRAVLMAGRVPTGGQEFRTTMSGFLVAQSLMIPSRIGEVRLAGGVIRSYSTPHSGSSEGDGDGKLRKPNRKSARLRQKT